MISPSGSDKNPTILKHTHTQETPIKTELTREIKKSSFHFSNEASQRIHEAMVAKPVEFDTHLSERMFAHVIGNGLISGETDLEGNVFADSLAYGVDEMTRVAQGTYGLGLNTATKNEFENMAKNLQSGRSRILDIYRVSSAKSPKNEANKLATKFANEANKLAPGGKMLIPGGWNMNGSGHALLYEIEKDLNGKFKLHLYNSGEGLSYHQSQVIDGELKYMCHRSWDLGTSIFDSQLMLQELILLRAGVEVIEGKPPMYQLYEGILAGLTELRTENPCWMSAQKSGICSWQSIVIWQKSQLDPELYRRVKLCTKIRAYRQMAAQYSSELKTDLRLQNIVARSLAITRKELIRAGLDANLASVDNIKPIDPPVSLKDRKVILIASNPESPLSKIIDSTITPTGVFSKEAIKAEKKEAKTKESWARWLQDEMKLMFRSLLKMQLKKEEELEDEAKKRRKEMSGL